MADAKVEISGLGYYPNPLSPNRDESDLAVAHLRKVIQAAALLGLKTVNTFIGRDWTKSVDDNWPRLLEIWKPLVKFAEGNGVRIGIENCPMLFSRDEWPGGKNLATSPKLWRRLFADIGSRQPRPQLRSVAHDLAAHGLPAADAGIQGPAVPRSRQGRADRPRAARRRRHPRPSQRISHAQAARPGRRRLGPVLLGAHRRGLSTARCASKSKTGPTRARSTRGRPVSCKAIRILRNFVPLRIAIMK